MDDELEIILEIPENSLVYNLKDQIFDDFSKNLGG
jgi:hypothetical protein